LSTDAESGAWPPGRDVEVDIKNPEVEMNPEGGGEAEGSLLTNCSLSDAR